MLIKKETITTLNCFLKKPVDNQKNTRSFGVAILGMSDYFTKILAIEEAKKKTAKITVALKSIFSIPRLER